MKSARGTTLHAHITHITLITLITLITHHTHHTHNTHHTSHSSHSSHTHPHQSSVQVSAGGVQVWRVNPDDVERCVWDVVRVAKELHSDESRYFRAVSLYYRQSYTHSIHTPHTSHTHTLHTHTHTQSQSYPLDDSAIQGLLQRAADAVSPLLDKLYEKAFQSHQSVFDPAVTKYDLTFRLKNSQRLLALVCCNLCSPMKL